MSELILKKILLALERIERRINQCELCQGAGARRFMQQDHVCAQCNGLGVFRYEPPKETE